MGYLIGVDVGGTNIVCGISDHNGRVMHSRKYPTCAEAGPEKVIETLAENIRRLTAEFGIGLSDIEAVGMGVPGIVDPVRGISVKAVNLGWNRLPVAERMRDLLHCPVYIDNDVRMYVYGETIRGAGQGHPFVLGVTIGTGLAAALVQNGEIYYGSSALAGELGHIPVEGIDIPCSCGNIGCLETVVSATGIARQAREKVEQGAAGLLSERFADNPAAITAFDVSQACREGDALAAEILADTGKTLGKALAYLVPILSPDVIVVGGGAAQAGPPLFDPLREALYSRLLSFYKERCKLAAAQLGDDAGVIGSAMRALQLSAKRSGS